MILNDKNTEFKQFHVKPVRHLFFQNKILMFYLLQESYCWYVQKCPLLPKHLTSVDIFLNIYKYLTQKS